ncbi:MFS transporter, partial [Micromonospora fluostatini]
MTFLVSALCLRAIRTVERRPAPRETAGSLRREITDGIRYVARDRYLRNLTLYGAACNAGLAGYQAVLVVFLVREVGLAPGLIGLMSLGGFVVAIR